MRMPLGHWWGAPLGGVLHGTLRTQMTIQTSKWNTKYRIKRDRNFSSEHSGFAIIANTANWHLSLGTEGWKTQKVRFLLKAQSICNLRQIVLATVQRYVSWEGWLWVEHGMCLKGWLTYPTPKAKLPLSWYSNTPSSKQHEYECSITRTSTPTNGNGHR